MSKTIGRISLEFGFTRPKGCVPWLTVIITGVYVLLHIDRTLLVNGASSLVSQHVLLAREFGYADWLVTSFYHLDIRHLLSNLIPLWIFLPALEYRLRPAPSAVDFSYMYFASSVHAERFQRGFLQSYRCFRSLICSRRNHVCR